MYIKLTNKDKKHRFWHKMKVVRDNGNTKYLECTKCKTRRIIQKGDGYQPISWDWFHKHTDKFSTLSYK